MDSLRIYIVSYNVACKPPEENLDELLSLDDSKEKLPDFYVVGLQEVKAQLYNMVLDALLDDPWTIAFKMKLKDKDYVKLKTVRLQGLILSIFCKRKHLLNVKDIETQYTKTGLGGFWGNKGGVSIRMNVYGVSLCVVNTHLTPHDQNLQARIQDYNQIVSATHFSRQKETSLIFYHDYVFWFGDNNFRIDEAISHEEILDKIRAKKLDWLKEVDQLKGIMRSGEGFSELTEEPFDFPPTYKFIFKSSDYDPKRRPAWTDRILYKVNSNAYENITLSAKMLFYKSFPSYIVSDHKPIAGEFKFKVFSDYTDQFIEFSPIKKWYINQENSVYFTADNIKVNDWDWIGIYKHNFCGLDEYVSFVYVNSVTSVSKSHSMGEASSSSSDSIHKEIKFPDNMVRVEGKYCLLYLTADSGSVLGISSVFDAEFKNDADGSQGMQTDGYDSLPSRHRVSPRRSPIQINSGTINSASSARVETQPLQSKSTTKSICDVYSGALEVHKHQGWFSKYKSVNFGLSDSYGSGRPTPLNSHMVRAEVEANPCQTVEKLSNTLNQPLSIIQEHMQLFGTVRRTSVRVPHNLC